MLALRKLLKQYDIRFEFLGETKKSYRIVGLMKNRGALVAFVTNKWKIFFKVYDNIFTFTYIK